MHVIAFQAFLIKASVAIIQPSIVAMSQSSWYSPNHSSNQWQKESQNWKSPSNTWHSSPKADSSSSWQSVPKHHSSTWDNYDQHHQGAQIPREFQQTEFHLDERTIKGVQLRRTIESTAWSRKTGLAGKPIQEVNLADVAFRGWNEQSLRYMSHGRFTSIIFTKSIAESVFVTTLLQQLRESKLDLDSLAEQMHKQKGTTVPSKHEDAMKFMEPVSVHVHESLQQLRTMLTPDECHPTVVALQAQLDRLKASGIKISPERTPPPKRKTRSVEPIERSQKTIRQAFKLPVSEDQQEPPEEKSPSQTPEDQDIFQPKAGNRPLATNKPETASSKDVAKWLAAIRKPMPRSKENKLRDHLQSVRNQFEEAKESVSIPDLAARYGLPVSMAAEAKSDDLVTMIGAVTFATA
jgi:hypothetical protein